MSSHLIQAPFATIGTSRTAQGQSTFWQRALQSCLPVFESIGRERAQRELRLMALRWDRTSPELARQARQAAKACATPSGV